MPVEAGRDSTGPYYRWGRLGFKYYYRAKDAVTRNAAKAAAAKQGRAIKANSG